MSDGRERFLHGAFIRLFRLWAASRTLASDGLAAMDELAGRLGLPAHTPAACETFFELIETRLGRALIAECCCSQRLSADEQALFRLIALAPEAGPALTTDRLPHGLPSAICWAAGAVRRALGLPPASADTPAGGTYPHFCPFRPAPAAVETSHGI